MAGWPSWRCGANGDSPAFLYAFMVMVWQVWLGERRGWGEDLVVVVVGGGVEEKCGWLL